MNIQKPLSAPLVKGQDVGRLVVKLDGEELLNTPLIALQDYPEGGFFSRLSDTVWLWFDDGE
jgi:D-alanyl-D-alanine carboxypeptidase (penicillin-binding protein 5/6)